jgi:hypothetical protein
MDHDQPGRRQSAARENEIKRAFGTNITLQPMNFVLVPADVEPAHLRAEVDTVEGPAARFMMRVFRSELPVEFQSAFDGWWPAARGGFMVHERETVPSDVLLLLDAEGETGDAQVPDEPVVRYELAMLAVDRPAGSTVYSEALIDPVASGRVGRAPDVWTRTARGRQTAHFFVDDGRMSWVDGDPVNTGFTSDGRVGNPNVSVIGRQDRVTRYVMHGFYREIT